MVFFMSTPEAGDFIVESLLPGDTAIGRFGEGVYMFHRFSPTETVKLDELPRTWIVAPNPHASGDGRRSPS